MSSLTSLELQHEIEQFVYLEVRLLDERRWQEWEELFAEGGTYWAPASHDQPDAEFHVSLIHEDALLRKVRQERFKHPNAFSLQPFPRTSHLVSNVMVDEYDKTIGIYQVNACFQMHEYRIGQPTVFAGSYHYLLTDREGDLRIVLKKATLVNCDGALTSSGVYF